MLNDFVNSLTRLSSNVRRFSAGEMIFDRDDAVTSLFVVDLGNVHLLRRQLDGAAFILQRAAKGEVLGEASLSSQNYHCAAMAVSDCQLRVFEAEHVRDLIDVDGNVAKAYANYLGRELRNARLRAEISFLRKVEDRLDAWLTWNDNIMPERGDWHRVAAEIGVSPEAFYRELARRRKNMAT